MWSDPADLKSQPNPTIPVGFGVLTLQHRYGEMDGASWVPEALLVVLLSTDATLDSRLSPPPKSAITAPPTTHLFVLLQCRMYVCILTLFYRRTREGTTTTNRARGLLSVLLTYNS